MQPPSTPFPPGSLLDVQRQQAELLIHYDKVGLLEAEGNRQERLPLHSLKQLYLMDASGSPFLDTGMSMKEVEDLSR